MKKNVNAVTWFEIYVKDMNRARKFYETVLDVELEYMSSPESAGNEYEMALFPFVDNAPNSSGALVQMNHVEAGGNSIVVYFASDDCSVEESRVADAGGRVERTKFSIGEHGFISLCFDTEGNCFGLHSMK